MSKTKTRKVTGKIEARILRDQLAEAMELLSACTGMLKLLDRLAVYPSVTEHLAAVDAFRTRVKGGGGDNG